MNKLSQLQKVESAIKPVLESMGYRLAERELLRESGRQVLRLYIDKEGGVTLDDCAALSGVLSAHLDVEDPIEGAYDLEVSSPGIERPLRYADDFKRFIGETIKLKTVEPQSGRQNYRGILKACDSDNIVMTVDGQDYTIALSLLAKARIVKDWNS